MEITITASQETPIVVSHQFQERLTAAQDQHMKTTQVIICT